MATTSRLYQILQGTPITATPTVQLLPSGVQGTRGALRRLVHPEDSTWPAIVYYRNPDRTLNFSTDYLRHPINSLVRTASSTKLVRFEEVAEDVIVTELWEAGGGLSLPLFVIHQLYEYLNNPPAFSATAQQYIVWEPRDETDDTYRVQVIGLQVGGGGGRYNMRRRWSNGGPNDPTTPGTILTPTDTMDVSPNPLMDQPVALTMRIIEKVA